jgi:Ala-tRNA(Pro) deacylase
MEAIMAMAMTLQSYLQNCKATYEVVPHAHSNSSMETAMAARIPADHMVKSVILGDDMGGYMMAVLPANCQVAVSKLGLHFGRNLHLASEREIANLFSDCETGAIPAIGQAYGMMTVIDDDLGQQADLYFEAGDHEKLIHMDTDCFMELMPEADHARFARPM